jgi:hypothetical protein
MQRPIRSGFAFVHAIIFASPCSTLYRVKHPVFAREVKRYDRVETSSPMLMPRSNQSTHPGGLDSHQGATNAAGLGTCRQPCCSDSRRCLLGYLESIIITLGLGAGRDGQAGWVTDMLPIVSSLSSEKRFH